MPQVSVIIPTYNRSQYLALAVRSILEQSFGDVEVLVIDDGSTDDTAEVVRGIADPRVRYFNQGKRERSAARNLGLAEAKGAFIGFLDDDDVWLPDLVQASLAVFRESGAGVVYTGWQCIDPDGNTLPQAATVPALRGDALSGQLCGTLAFHGALVRRNCTDAVGEFDGSVNIAEDWDYWIRLAAHGFAFDCVPHAMVLYRVHGLNTSKNLDGLEAALDRVLNKSFASLNGTRYMALHDSAFGRLKLGQAIKRLGIGHVELGNQLFRRAIEYAPSLLDDLSTYYQTICAMQPDGYKGRFEYLDLSLGESLVTGALDTALQGSATLKETRSSAFGYAYLVLGLLYYGTRNMRAARQTLQKAIRFNPRLASRKDVYLTAAKSLIPPSLIHGWQARGRAKLHAHAG